MGPPARLVRSVIGNGAERLAVLDMDIVAPIGIGLAAARTRRHVRPHQLLIPLAHFRRVVDGVPLAEVARLCATKMATNIPNIIPKAAIFMA
jgi:hypothetical protein